MNILIVYITSFLSGWAICDIGDILSIPYWLTIILSCTFGWVLAGTIKS